MKKIWNDGTALGTMEIALIASIVLIGGSIYALVHTWEETEGNDERDRTMIVTDGNYIIEIIDVQSESLDDVSWSILNLSRLVPSWDGPSGETLRMEGDLNDINFSMSDYNGADETAYDKFYSQDPVGTPPVSINHTLYVVYMDVNVDGKFSSGDVIWIRSMENGGPADEDFRFRLVNERVGKAYGEMLLIAV